MLLSQSHFIALTQIPNIFQTRLGILAYVINCIRQPVAQESDKIHVLYARKFCRPTSGVGILKESRYSTSIELALVYIRSV